MDICTKFEVSMYTRYEEMKGGAKCKNGVWGRSPFVRTHMTFNSTLIETMRLCCTVFEIIASHLSNVADFYSPHLHLASQLG